MRLWWSIKIESYLANIANSSADQNRESRQFLLSTIITDEFFIASVTDEMVMPLEYSWNDDELRIGNKIIYVGGRENYIIKFTAWCN